MPLLSKSDENIGKQAIRGSRFSRQTIGGGGGNRCINMKRTGVLWKRRMAEKELTLVDERGARTYSADPSVLMNLRSSKVCDGTFVEVKVRRNVIESLCPVEFEGKVKKFAKKYAFLSTPILPQIKLKGDCKRAVAECRIVKNPPKALANVWFNPTSLQFPIVNDQTVFFSVCVTLRRIKRTRNPPYLDVHAVKIRTKDENVESSTDGSTPHPSVAGSKLSTTKSPVEEKSKAPAEEPENPEDSLRDWMVDRMGVKVAKELGTPQYESKPAPKVSKAFRRSRSATDLASKKPSRVQRLSNTQLLVTPALLKHRQRLAAEKQREDSQPTNPISINIGSFPVNLSPPKRSPNWNGIEGIRQLNLGRTRTRPVNSREVLPSGPPSRGRGSMPLLPSGPPRTLLPSSAPEKSSMMFSESNFLRLAEEQRERDIDAQRNSPMRTYFGRNGLKSSYSANDISYAPFRREYPQSPVRSYRDNETCGSTHASTDAALTSIAGRTSPTLSWIDGGLPLNSPMTIADHETTRMHRNLPSMPDLTRVSRVHGMNTKENIYRTNFNEQDSGIFRALSAPRLCTLEENYLAKFQARDLDSENSFFQDTGMGHHVGEPHFRF